MKLFILFDGLAIGIAIAKYFIVTGNPGPYNQQAQIQYILLIGIAILITLFLAVLAICDKIDRGK